jgi:hypothetical protein
VAVAVLTIVAAGASSARSEVNPDADEILRSMSSFLGGAKALSVTTQVSNEVVTKEGEKLQLNSSGKVVLQRPSGLFLTRQGRFADAEMFFDGKRVAVFGKGLNAYVEREVAGSIDELVATIQSELGLDLPGADLLVADPYAALSPGITSSGYHGTAYVQGVECHHLSFREDDVDWQLWVATGDQPLPMKYVITTKWLTGAPQYSIELRDWNLAPSIPADRFTFSPPNGAAKLEGLPVDETGELRPVEENKR